MTHRKLISLVVIAVALVSNGAAALAEDIVCRDFRKLGWPNPSSLDDYELVDSFLRGAREEAIHTYYNIDLDGDDRGDILEYGCSASTVPADPCILTVKLASGGKFDFESWTMRLVRLKGQIYVVAWPYPAIAEAARNQIFRVNATGVTKVCETR